MTTKPPQNAKLNHKQEIALAALMSGKNRREAAEAAGCNPRTIHDWMEPGHAFRVEYDHQIAALHSVVRSRFRAILDIGTESMVHMLKELRDDFDSTNDADTRIKIANTTKSAMADIASRTGHPSTSQAEVVVEQSTGDRLAKARQRANLAGLRLTDTTTETP